MARVRPVPAVFDDLDRIVEHLHQHDVENAEARAKQIIGAFDLLAIRAQREGGCVRS